MLAKQIQKYLVYRDFPCCEVKHECRIPSAERLIQDPTMTDNKQWTDPSWIHSQDQAFPWQNVQVAIGQSLAAQQTLPKKEKHFSLDFHIHWQQIKEFRWHLLNCAIRVITANPVMDSLMPIRDESLRQSDSPEKHWDWGSVLFGSECWLHASEIDNEESNVWVALISGKLSIGSRKII